MVVCLGVPSRPSFRQGAPGVACVDGGMFALGFSSPEGFIAFFFSQAGFPKTRAATVRGTGSKVSGTVLVARRGRGYIVKSPPPYSSCVVIIFRFSS